MCPSQETLTSIPFKMSNTSTPSVSSKPTKPTDIVKCMYVVKRNGDEFAMEITTELRGVAGASRAFNDAVDAFLIIYRQVNNSCSCWNSDDTNGLISWDMIKFRKICNHKGEEEQERFSRTLEFMIKKYTNWKIKSFGFPLDNKGNIIDDSILRISISR